MANIIAYIRKEAEKGNTLMDAKGNFINPEKLENSMRKSYLAGLKNGSISFDKPFAEYQNNEIEKTYIPTSIVADHIAWYIDPNVSADKMSDDCMPEPTESIAQ